MLLIVTNLARVKHCLVRTCVLHFCPTVLATLAAPASGSLFDKQPWS